MVSSSSGEQHCARIGVCVRERVFLWFRLITFLVCLRDGKRQPGHVSIRVLTVHPNNDRMSWQVKTHK